MKLRLLLLSLCAFVSQCAPVLAQTPASSVKVNPSTGVLIDPSNFITGNNMVVTTGAYSNPSWITALAWSKISSTPTTLSGYGITDAQPLDSDLTSIAALTTTTFGRSLLTQANAAAAQATLGLVIGTNVQAWSAKLDDLANNTPGTVIFNQVFPVFAGLGGTPLNATNLTSGTVPNGAFPATLPTASGVNLTNIKSANLTDPGSNTTVTLGHLTLGLYGLPFAASDGLLRFGNKNHTFLHAQAVEAIEADELLLVDTYANENVLAIQNNATGGYSALTCRNSDGYENFVFGHGNSGTIPTMFAGANYLENWSGHGASPTAPPEFFVASDGGYGSLGSGFRFYKRFRILTDGTPVFAKLIPWNTGSEQRENLAISDTAVSGTYGGVAKTFNGTLLSIGRDGNSSDTNPTGFQAEIRAGPDDNAAIVLRSVEGVDEATQGGATDFHIYGGTRANGCGYRFYTGVRDSAQTLEFQVASDRIAHYIPDYLAPQAAPSSPAQGDFYLDSTSHLLTFYNWLGNWSSVISADSGGFTFVPGSTPILCGNGHLELEGNDGNAAICLREGTADVIDYYSYGGTLSGSKGHRFYTGGLRGSQTLRFEVADDGAKAFVPLTVGTSGVAASQIRYGSTTLVAGTKTVTDATVTTNTRIFPSAQDNNTTGTLRISARTAGTGFTITSSNSGDTGVVAYQMIEP